MSWRERLAFWCVRVLVPKGLGHSGTAVELSFSPGRSHPDDPKLVLHLDRPGGQPVISVLCPDDMVGVVTRAVNELDRWSKAVR